MGSPLFYPPCQRTRPAVPVEHRPTLHTPPNRHRRSAETPVPPRSALRRRQLARRLESRLRFAFDCPRQAVIRAVARVGIGRTGTTRLTALDGTLGDRAAPHGLWCSQFVGELTDGGWDVGRSGHALSYGIISRKIKRGNAASLRALHFSICTLGVVFTFPAARLNVSNVLAFAFSPKCNLARISTPPLRLVFATATDCGWNENTGTVRISPAIFSDPIALLPKGRFCTHSASYKGSPVLAACGGVSFLRRCSS